MQSANDLKTRIGVKKADGTAQQLQTKKTKLKRALAKGFQYIWINSYGHEDTFITKLELHSSEKVILCCRNTDATYKLSNFFLKYDTIFGGIYAIMISELRNITVSIPYPK